MMVVMAKMTMMMVMTMVVVTDDDCNGRGRRCIGSENRRGSSCDSDYGGENK